MVRRVETEQSNAALVILIKTERNGRSIEAVAHEWASQMCDAARAGDEKAKVYDALADEAIVRAACEEAEERPESARSGPETAEQGDATCAQARADDEEVERLRSEVTSASKAEERTPEAALLPTKGTPARAQALRWLLFPATEIYPIVEINDYPERFATVERRLSNWRIKGAAERPLSRPGGVDSLARGQPDQSMLQKNQRGPR